MTNGKLPTGCILCEKGAKLVLLVTGQCSCSCFYCPLSLEKQGRDVIFADELAVTEDNDIIFEAESISAEGTGITGGDPLLNIDRTVGYIRLLKEHFGDEHHIHLYTATPDLKKVKLLADAGLDEIRFHPPTEFWDNFDKTRFSDVIRISRENGMDVGLEIPTLPDRYEETMALIKSADELGVQFINLNELEFSESNWQALKEHGYEVKDDISSGVKGSEETARKILENAETDMPLHYCSASFKDGIQLRRRIMRRAENTATPLEIITDDGTFLKGVIECDDPKTATTTIADEFEIPKELIRFDAQKNRIEMAAWILEEIHDDINGLSFIVEEYPTADRLEVERRPLKQQK